jgi:uncharacterized protein YicC (UPF0701 family)
MTQDERFDRIDANIERLSERLAASSASLDAHINHLTQFALDFREETAQRLEIIDNRLDVMAANINNIEARFPTITKAILDFGKHTTQLTNEQARNKVVNADLAARMGSLEEKVSKLIHPAA